MWSLRVAAAPGPVVSAACGRLWGSASLPGFPTRTASPVGRAQPCSEQLTPTCGASPWGQPSLNSNPGPETVCSRTGLDLSAFGDMTCIHALRLTCGARALRGKRCPSHRFVNMAPVSCASCIVSISPEFTLTLIPSKCGIVCACIRIWQGKDSTGNERTEVPGRALGRISCVTAGQSPYLSEPVRHRRSLHALRVTLE